MNIITYLHQCGFASTKVRKTVGMFITGIALNTKETVVAQFIPQETQPIIVSTTTKTAGSAIL